MGQNGTQTHNPDLNIVGDASETLATNQADKIYELLPKLQVLMAAVKQRHQEQTSDDVLLGVGDLLLEVHGELARIARKLEESQ